MTTEEQYIKLLERIVTEGVWVENKRTNTRCKTIINYQITIDVEKGEFPLLTTRKVNFRGAIGEMLGYLRGYRTLEQFHSIGVKTWDANANNPIWLDSPYNKDPGNDLGLIYGVAGNVIVKYDYGRQEKFQNELFIYQGHKTDWLKSLIDKIKEGNDDRGLIWSFWKPELFHMGCLRPCMYEHQFSLLGNDLYLTTTQRSQDCVLGGAFNLVQCYFLLEIVAKLTGKNPKTATLNIVNAHIYEDQLPVLIESGQLDRQPYNPPGLVCTKPITYESVFGLCENEEDNLHPRDFEVINYLHHPVIKYPFTV